MNVLITYLVFRGVGSNPTLVIVFLLFLRFCGRAPTPRITMATFRLGARILKLSHKQPTRTLFSSTKTAPPRSPILTGFYRTFFVLGTGLFAVYYFDARSAVHRYFLTPALRYTLDAETGHKVAVKVLRSGLGPKDPVTDDEKLTFEVSNIICAWRCIG